MLIFGFMSMAVGCRIGSSDCSVLKNRLCKGGWQAACMSIGRLESPGYKRGNRFCVYMDDLLDSGKRRQW